MNGKSLDRGGRPVYFRTSSKTFSNSCRELEEGRHCAKYVQNIHGDPCADVLYSRLGVRRSAHLLHRKFHQYPSGERSHHYRDRRKDIAQA